MFGSSDARGAPTVRCLELGSWKFGSLDVWMSGCLDVGFGYLIARSASDGSADHNHNHNHNHHHNDNDKPEQSRSA